ncbi:MAG: hypothetical protein QOI17_1395, partial [Gaiellales bacterium]|nr:hypothetical protein [Gaiellales bacterium]
MSIVANRAGRLLAAAGLAVALGGCVGGGSHDAGSAGSRPGPAGHHKTGPQGIHKIKHVIIVMQE